MEFLRFHEMENVVKKTKSSSSTTTHSWNDYEENKESFRMREMIVYYTRQLIHEMNVHVNTFTTCINKMFVVFIYICIFFFPSFSSLQLLFFIWMTVNCVGNGDIKKKAILSCNANVIAVPVYVLYMHAAVTVFYIKIKIHNFIALIDRQKEKEREPVHKTVVYNVFGIHIKPLKWNGTIFPFPQKQKQKIHQFYLTQNRKLVSFYLYFFFLCVIRYPKIKPWLAWPAANGIWRHENTIIFKYKKKKKWFPFFVSHFIFQWHLHKFDWTNELFIAPVKQTKKKIKNFLAKKL